MISRAREAGVDRMFVVGFDTPTIERTMELIDKYEFVYGIIGGILSMQLIVRMRD